MGAKALRWIAVAAAALLPMAALAMPSPSPSADAPDPSAISYAGASPVDGCPQFFDFVPAKTLHDCVVALAAKGWGLSAVDVFLYTYSGAFAPGLPRREPENQVIGDAPKPNHAVGMLSGLDGVLTDVVEAGTGHGRCDELDIYDGYWNDDDVHEAKARSAYVAAVSKEAAHRCVPADYAVVAGQEDESGRVLALFVPGDPQAFGSLLYGSPAESAAFEKRAAARALQPLIVRSDYELWGRAPTPHRIDRRVPRTRDAILAHVRAAFARGEQLTGICYEEATVTMVWTTSK